MTLWVSSSPVLILKRSILEMRGKLNDFVCNSFICVARTCPPPIHELFEGFLMEFRQGFLRKSLVKRMIKKNSYEQSCWALHSFQELIVSKSAMGLSSLKVSPIFLFSHCLKWMGAEGFKWSCGEDWKMHKYQFWISLFYKWQPKKLYWWR